MHPPKCTCPGDCHTQLFSHCPLALSLTEAEFVAATATGKAILYVRTIHEELGIPQTDATVLYIENNGALNMANQGQLTQNTRNMELKSFAIQQWVE